MKFSILAVLGILIRTYAVDLVCFKRSYWV